MIDKRALLERIRNAPVDRAPDVTDLVVWIRPEEADYLLKQIEANIRYTGREYE